MLRWERLVLTIYLCLPASLFAQPRAAPGIPADDVYHGITVRDPYRNLEDLKNPQTREWLLAQGEYAASLLSRIEGRDALYQRIAALSATTGDVVRTVVRRGERVFYLKRKAGDRQFRLVMRIGLDGAERVLVDPQAMAANGVPQAINYFTPSWDGHLVAYGVSAGGSEDASLHVMDVDSGRQTREPIPRVHEPGATWSPDDRWLGFNQLRPLPPGAPESETYFDSTVYVLDLRRPDGQPQAVFGRQLLPSLEIDRLDVGQLIFSHDSPYMLLRTTDTTVPEGRLFIAPVSALGQKVIGWRPVSSAADQITDAKLRGGTIYLRTRQGAPRGRVIALDGADPRLDRAVTVIPEPERGVLQSFQPGRRAIYTEEREGFVVRAVRYDPEGPGSRRVVTPRSDISTYALVDRTAKAEELWVATSAWTEPSRILAVSEEGGFRDTGLRSNPRPVDAVDIQVTEVEVPSHDGVRIPLVVLHRKGLTLNGRNPTLLAGYGAYGFTIQAWYDPRSLAWLERGGVFALVNPRGSGAYGDAWHRAGFKSTKPNTWKDGVAAARWLIDAGYASPKTLGVKGGSAGGIFVGRAVTSAPELFAAAIMNVPMMDTVRSEVSANGATNTSEFGTVNVKSEFIALLEMSTYHQIVDGARYPAILFTHGMNDPRVDVWQSAKAVARFQQATKSGAPVLLRLDQRAGHGIGSGEDQIQALLADEWSFLLWQFGVVGLKP